MRNGDPCPICGEKIYAEYVDIGVGHIQCEPYHCEHCGWAEGCVCDTQSRVNRCKSEFICQRARAGGHIVDQIDQDVPPTNYEALAAEMFKNWRVNGGLDHPG